MIGDFPRQDGEGPELPDSCIFRPFPGAPAAAPLAALSLASAGDLRYSWPEPNPERVSFLAGFRLKQEDLASPRLLHSRIVLRAGRGGSWEPGARADGIASELDGPIPAVTVADCMPIWILDRKRGIRALLHSGWQGTGICLECLDLMKREWGTEAGDCSAILGPSIGPCCYRVDPERAVQYLDAWGEDAAHFTEGSWRLDLAAANRALLQGAGIGELDEWKICTCCDTRMGSSRRQGRASFTRMLAFFFDENAALKRLRS